MSKKILIEKASGEMQVFSREKLITSLRRSGADESVIMEIVKDIEGWITEGMPTHKIYNRAFALLRRRRRTIASRYSLKKAIMDLGPSGYPFEHFIGQLFRRRGYDIEVGKIVDGNCVTHEVDVIASNENFQHLVECKFYNSPGKHAGVQVPLYIHSRVNDIVKFRKNLPAYHNFTFQGWVVTNTRFTSDALDYGLCCGLKLLSWDYPSNNSLREIIEDMNVFPVTVLTHLTKQAKTELLNKGIVLCSQISEQPDVLDSTGLQQNKIPKVIQEVEDLSQF